jgi:site-specific DNA-methyltransferase (adenine-specific)
MKQNGIELIHGDNMDLLRSTPDKFYDLAIVDPPYGIGAENHAGNADNGWKQWTKKSWDSSIPDAEYFEQLFRVSKNQIVWGGNYFTEYLPPSMGWILWDKGQRDFSLADGELAWTSFNKALRIFEMSRGKALAKNNEQGGRFHPTQKPEMLYDWILKNYVKEGNLILDTHLGSGSIAIAIDKANRMEGMNLTFTGIELDKEYFDSAVKRFNQYANQTTIFDI